MKHIIWLASYPKSGNTWLRIFLDSYLCYNGGKVDINNLSIGRLRPLLERKLFNEFLGFDSTDLTLNETNSYRRKYIANFGASLKKETLVKTHAANIILEEGVTLIPEEVSKLAVYIVRNPLSVVPSLANHFSETIEESIFRLNSSELTAYKDKRVQQSTIANTQLKSWSEHVSSWLNQEKIEVLVVKYEELLIKPYETFKSLILKVTGEVDEQRLKRAYNNTSFKNLASQEKTQGFKEAPHGSNKFFRKGVVDSWKKELNAGQVEEITNVNRKIMSQLGYL